MTVVGIDLGTTNTVVASVRDGQAAALHDELGFPLIPSVVSFHPNGTVLVGRAARERRLIDPRNTIFSIKRLIGRSWESEEVRRARLRFPFDMREGPGQAALVVARNETYTLPEISAFVLRKAKAVAELALATTIERAVITVPANFNDLQRAATKVAGRVGGLEVLRILNEPTAAALAYGYGKGASERIAVYDFGGGTFDVTLLDLADNVFEVLATAGNTFLGGDDIDVALAERICDACLQQHRYDPRSERTAFERVRLAAEELKMQLSTSLEATVQLSEIGHAPGGKPIGMLFSMTRAEFEQLITPIVDRTFDVCREALGIARLSTADMREVLLVGGSTRIPLVRRRVEEFFGRESKAHINPDEVVAIGAAIQANALTGMERRRGTVPPAPVPYGRGTQPPVTRNTQAPGTSPGLGTRTRSKLPSITDTEGTQQRLRLSSLPPHEVEGDAFSPNTKPFSRQRASTADNLGQFRPRLDTTPMDPAFGNLAPPPERRMKTGMGLGPPPAPSRRESIPDAPLPPVPPVPPLPPAAPPAAATFAYQDKATLLSAAEAAEKARAAATSQSGKRHEESVAMELDDDDLEYTQARGSSAPPSEIEDIFDHLPLPEVPRPPPQPDAFPQAPRSVPTPFIGSPPVSPIPPAAPAAAAPSSAAPAAALGGTALGIQPGAFGAVGLPPWAPNPAEDVTRSVQNFGTLQEGTPHRVAPASVRPMAAAPPVLVDVTPLTLCVETVSGYCDPLIERNSPVPCERTRQFVTAADNQTLVRVRVGQGESSRFAENTILGELELSGLRPGPRGSVVIEVTFALDTSGMLNVRARDVATGRETSAQVRLIGLPDAGEVAGLVARNAMYRTH